MKITDDMLTEEQRSAVEIALSLIGLSSDPRTQKAYKGLRSLLAARRTTPDRECEWKCDDVDNGIWESSCGESWSFIDGGPVENRMLFCHRCGGKLKTAPTSDQGEKS